MKSLRTVLAASLLSSLISLAGPAAADAPSGPVPAKVAATQAAERDLWVGHIFWVREVVRGLAEKIWKVFAPSSCALTAERSSDPAVEV